MHRRKAISIAGTVISSTLLGDYLLFLSGCKQPGKPFTNFYSTEDVYLFTEIGGTIMPATDTPGARENRIGEFIAIMLSDSFSAVDRKNIADGIASLNENCNKSYGKKFIDCTDEQRYPILKTQDAAVKIYKQKQQPGQPPHFFWILKELTIFGFFNSEQGAKHVLRYDPIPGKYLGDIPYKKGDRAWATY